MRLVMGIIVVAMGIVVTAHTSMGFVQIVGGRSRGEPGDRDGGGRQARQQRGRATSHVLNVARNDCSYGGRAIPRSVMIAVT